MQQEGLLSFPSSPASSGSAGRPVLPTWAVEVRGGPRARKANEAALAAAIADSKLALGGVALKIVHVLTRVPCDLGGELTVSKVDKRTIHQYELRVFQNLIQPLVAAANAQKVPVRFVPVINDSREAGLVEAVERMGACRLYITESRSPWTAFAKLSIQQTLPGGCTLVSTQEGGKARGHHVQGISSAKGPKDLADMGAAGLRTGGIFGRQQSPVCSPAA